MKFSVLYDSLTYREITEEAKIPWDAFLGTLGGHFHLFLGMSLISVDIFDLSILMCMYFYVKKKKKYLISYHFYIFYFVYVCITFL